MRLAIGNWGLAESPIKLLCVILKTNLKLVRQQYKLLIMKRLFFAGLTIFIILSSCNKNEDKSILPNGLFTEKSPIENRSQIEFINGNLMIKSEVGSSFRDTFNYEIFNSKIKLTPAWTNASSSEFTFKMINISRFEIENLYPSIPESPTIFMTFEK